jgi:hypothetical protein
MAVVRTCSRLHASAGDVWAHATQMAGVNWELSPYVRMTVPRRAKDMTIGDAPIGIVAFRSVLLAFTVVPFDVHAFQLDAVTPPHGFVEESTSLVQRRWRHERTITATADRECEVIDTIAVDPRLRCTEPLVAAVVRFLFRHRHQRLRTRFGAPKHTA